MSKYILTILITLIASTSNAAQPIGTLWGFFGDSQTAGRAPAESSCTSSSECIGNILSGTSYVNGLSGRSLAGSHTAYDGYASKANRTWIHFQESGDQNNDGQRTAGDFGTTFVSSMTNIHSDSPNAVISYETAFSFGREAESYRNWTTYNTQLLSSVSTLAGSGVAVIVADVDANIKVLQDIYTPADVWYQDGDANEFHYTAIGNLMVALTVIRSLGYNLNALSYIGVSDIDSGVLAAAILIAQPISGISGSVVHGQSLTISGSGFGIKSPVAPLLWDSVDNSYTTKTEGEMIPVGSGYTWNDPGGASTGLQPYFTNTNPRGKWTAKYTNSYSVDPQKAAVIGEKDCPACIGNQIYISYWQYLYTNPTNPGASNKLLRITEDGGYGGDADLVMLDPGAGMMAAHSAPTGYTIIDYTSNWGQVAAWSRLEVIVDNSTTPNPTVLFNVDSAESASGQADESMNDFAGIFTIGADFTNAQDTPVDTLDFGEIYVDNTRARVEICAGSTWVARGHCEIQIPHTTWGDTSLQVMVNQGSFADDSTAYLYVVDASGKANSSGLEIIFEELEPVLAALTGGTLRGGKITH